ncbi:DUF6777 domain-containing protein [Streptomyces sp. NPDC056527]|uniref:DUF6777 domain-containing protein n=1 Tax=Streptomyces sp. NPDC056527 TaxID=3345853 RepID=UPI003692BCBB
MTSHPPSGRPSVPPSGPPSGPLSGPSTRPGAAGPPPPPDRPHDGSGGGSGGSGGPGGPGDGSGAGGTGGGAGGGSNGPWWRSVPKVASITAILVAAIALVVVLTRPDGNGDDTAAGGGEVFLQNASATGPDPFTASTARTPSASPTAAPLPSPTQTADANATRSVSGSAAGLYGGTRNVASCDVERQVRYLTDEPAKNAAFASAQKISANEVPRYLRSLTPLQLRVDTRVTNHGYRGGAATPYQAVLQAGTAVLVDDRGVPRVRCACGNPLTTPVPQKAPKTTGTAWPGYQPSQVVVVAPSVQVVNVFVVYDPEDDGWFARKPGDQKGKQDKPTTRPTAPPSPSISDSGTGSPSESTPATCVTPRGGETAKPCPTDTSTTSPPATEGSVTPPKSDPATDGTTSGETTDGATGDATDGTTNRSAPAVNPETSATTPVAPGSSVIGSSPGPVPQPGPEAHPLV